MAGYPDDEAASEDQMRKRLTEGTELMWVMGTA